MTNFYFQILIPLLLLFLGVMFSALTVSTTPLTSLATPVSYNATPQVHFYDSNLAADNQCPVVSTIGDFGSNLTAIVIDNTVNVLEEIDANGGVALDGDRASLAPGLGFEYLPITGKGSSFAEWTAFLDEKCSLPLEPTTCVDVVFSTALIRTTEEQILPISDGAARPRIELPSRIRSAVRGMFDGLSEMVEWGHIGGFFLVLMALFWSKISTMFQNWLVDVLSPAPPAPSSTTSASATAKMRKNTATAKKRKKIALAQTFELYKTQFIGVFLIVLLCNVMFIDAAEQLKRVKRFEANVKYHQGREENEENARRQRRGNKGAATAKFYEQILQPTSDRFKVLAPLVRGGEKKVEQFSEETTWIQKPEWVTES